MIAIYELGVEEILVIGHTDCGVQHMDAENLLENMRKRGISNNAIESLRYCGIDFDRWLEGFDDGCVSVAKSVELLKTSSHTKGCAYLRIYYGFHQWQAEQCFRIGTGLSAHLHA